MELDVHVAVLVGAAVLRHALVLDALPGVGGDDLAGGAGDLEDAVVQVLDGEGRAAESLGKRDLLQICEFDKGIWSMRLVALSWGA